MVYEGGGGSFDHFMLCAPEANLFFNISSVHFSGFEKDNDDSKGYQLDRFNSLQNPFPSLHTQMRTFFLSYYTLYNLSDNTN